MTKFFLCYPKGSIGRARGLRKRMTDTELIMWSNLRNNQLGVKFRRQVAFGPFILDFLCISAKLAIEIDGSQHFTERGIREDKVRDEYLLNHGVEVMRFPNVEVIENLEGVLELILQKVRQRTSHDPTLPSP